MEQIEKARDSQLAREIEAALPRELSGEEQLALVLSLIHIYTRCFLEIVGEYSISTKDREISKLPANDCC